MNLGQLVKEVASSHNGVLIRKIEDLKSEIEFLEKEMLVGTGKLANEQVTEKIELQKKILRIYHLEAEKRNLLKYQK